MTALSPRPRLTLFNVYDNRNLRRHTAKPPLCAALTYVLACPLE